MLLSTSPIKIQCFLLVGMLLQIGCQQTKIATPIVTPVINEQWQMPSRNLCHRSYAEIPKQGAQLQEPLLVETSGIVASLKDPTLLWLHNDSGDASRIYAVDVSGRARLRLIFENTTFVDVEDIAAGPCPDQSGPCLFVADTGDNKHQRTDAAIYIFAEPDVQPWNEQSSSSASVEERTFSDFIRVPISYPAGESINIEAMIALPSGEGIALFEKAEAEQARVLFLPLSKEIYDDTLTFPLELSVAATIPSPGLNVEYGRLITGADLHPSFEQLILRTYSGLFLYDLPQKKLTDLEGQTAQIITFGPSSEPQGEAICYDATGTGLWTISEDVNNVAGQPLHQYPCQ